LGSTIADAQKQVNAAVELQEGYRMTWNGEFENQTRAQKTLSNVVPLCLVAIFLILFTMFGNGGDALLVLMNVPFALIGGIIALHVVMTATMAAIGLMPAALSTGIGSETQKPLAIVVIGGLFTATIGALMILPVIYSLYYRFVHNRKNRQLIKQINSVS
jgi:heavy metal efflux system protein